LEWIREEKLKKLECIGHVVRMDQGRKVKKNWNGLDV